MVRKVPRRFLEEAGSQSTADVVTRNSRRLVRQSAATARKSPRRDPGRRSQARQRFAFQEKGGPVRKRMPQAKRIRTPSLRRQYGLTVGRKTKIVARSME